MIKKYKQPLIHLSLFIVTFITTTLAGAEWTYGKSIFNPLFSVADFVSGMSHPFLNPDFSWADFVNGMSYSIPFLLILTAHEFGHYFTAIYHAAMRSVSMRAGERLRTRG